MVFGIHGEVVECPGAPAIASDPDIESSMSNRPRLTSLSKTLVSFKIPEAGHMYDLAASHPKDLPAVRMVRPYNKPLKLIIC